MRMVRELIDQARKWVGVNTIKEIVLVCELRVLADYLAGTSTRKITIGEMEELVADITNKIKQLKFR